MIHATIIWLDTGGHFGGLFALAVFMVFVARLIIKVPE